MTTTRPDITPRWVQFGSGSGTLHRFDPPTLEADEDLKDEAAIDDAMTRCGRSGRLFLPGVFSRMGADRCKQCCTRVGLPFGVGTPVNAGMDVSEGY